MHEPAAVVPADPVDGEQFHGCKSVQRTAGQETERAERQFALALIPARYLLIVLLQAELCRSRGGREIARTFG